MQRSSKKFSPKQKPKKVQVMRDPGRMHLPVGRLPRHSLVYDNLSAKVSVYPRIDLDVPISAGVVSVVSGNLSSVVTLGTPSNVGGWSTRFQTLFDEYCIVGFRIGIRQLNAPATASANAGYVQAALDEKSSNAPTQAGMNAVPRVEIPILSTLTAESPIHWIQWKATDYTDLDWTPTTSTTTPIFLKLYSNTASTGTSTTTGASFEVFGSYAIAFRGYAGS